MTDKVEPLTAEGGGLYWHCATCANHEPAQSEYEHGDCEPCCLCDSGVARVMTLKEAAALEQARALSGLPPRRAVRSLLKGETPSDDNKGGSDE